MRPLLGALALALGAACRSPDVVFLTVDTLRVDHVGAFSGDSPAATPHIDALAADSVRYGQAYSPISVTGPAFCSLHTGLDPSGHGVTMNLFRGGARLGPEVQTLAEALAADGYQTGAFVSGFTLRPELGLDQGFAVYSPPEGNRRPGSETLDVLLGWAEQNSAWKPRFLWWHTYDPHGPLDPWGARPKPGAWPRDTADRAHIPKYQRLYGVTAPGFYAERYARAVEHTDDQVGRALAWLKEQGRYDDALIVLTADHGETFTERPLWFDHGTSAHEEQLHVPLLIKYPDGWGAGTQVDDLVGLEDVMPTVLAAVGLPAPDGLAGRDLRAAPAPAVRTGESSHCKGNAVLRCAPKGPAGKQLAARDDRYTLVLTPTADGPERALFDRETDPGERVPLDPAPADPALAQALDALAADRAARDYSAYDRPAQTEEERAEQEALEALGYQER